MNNNRALMVSVIMPVYNGERFIGEAIDSVLKQTYSNIELLIINDGSVDNTEATIQKHILGDRRVRCFKQVRKGVAAARNVGLRNMNGEFFCFLDADDSFPVNAIQARMDKFSSDPYLVYCDGSVTIFDETLRQPVGHWKPRYTGQVFKKLIRMSPSCFFGVTWLVKRSAAVAYAFHENLTHAEDLLFYIEISRTGKYDFVDENVLNYRNSSRSAMKNLKGLAHGYTTLYQMVVSKFPKEVSLIERIYLWYKIRKVMFLSFLAAGEIGIAFNFLITGKAK